jgi:hypothetical protein
MPTSFQTAGLIAGLLKEMLARSDEFRSQCERLARQPWVYVRLKLAKVPLPYSFHGRTIIARTLEGPIVATVEIDPRASWHEWIAHEIEHVLEQADGMRLIDLRQGNSWESSDSTYETQRAVDAGRLVSREMRQARRPRRAADRPLAPQPSSPSRIVRPTD